MGDNSFGKNSISVDEARRLISSGLRLVDIEQVGLNDALGRVTATSIKAKLRSPPFDVSAMDGYAVRAADVPGPGFMLPVAGISKAGTAAVPVLHPETCMRIFTGAPVPAGANAIILQEDTEPAGDRVRFLAAATKGLHIREAGLNFEPGRTVVAAGRIVNARDMGLLAAAGHASVAVRVRPRVAVLSTGDELAHAPDSAAAALIADANRPALMGAIRAWGGSPIDLGVAGDADAAIKSALDGLEADLLVITGGASVGDHDRVRPALQALGFVFDFWKIRMRPGKPLMFGMLGKMPVIGMPGNPVSAMVCSLLFLKPAIATMTGAKAAGAEFENARLAAPIGQTGERDDYLRATLTHEDGGLVVEAFRLQDSSMLSLLAASNALLFRPAGAPPAQRGDMVKVIRFDAIPGY